MCFHHNTTEAHVKDTTRTKQITPISRRARQTSRSTSQPGAAALSVSLRLISFSQKTN